MNNKILLSVITMMLCFAGCANYRLGTTLPKHIKTIYVENFRNQTIEPNIEGRITADTRARFQRDGQLKVVSKDEADIVLNATLLSYDIESLLYDRNNPKMPRSYSAKISCKIAAVDTASGETIVDTTVTGDTTFPAAGSSITARKNALGGVSKDLAKEVVDAVVGAW